MLEPRIKDKGKKKVPEVKTFPVSFSLEEIQEKMNINTYSSFQPTREQIIDKAFKFHREGKISEAAKFYKYFIDQGYLNHHVFCNYGGILRELGNLKEAELFTRKAIELNPHYPEAYSNLGSILRDLGKLQEAELFTRKAIELNPHYPEVYCNLGSILRDLSKLQEAELFTRKAIEIHPDYAMAHSNLGNILRDLGKLQEAELSTRKAIEIHPDYAMAHFNLGNILRDLGKSNEALTSYIKAIKINPSLPNFYQSLTRFVKDSDPFQFNKSKLKYILSLLLQKNDVSHNELFKVFYFLYSKEIIIHLNRFESNLFKENSLNLFSIDQIIIDALKKITFTDIILEKTLTKTRQSICHLIAKNTEELNHSELQFLSALGEQCFLNEYIYPSTHEEDISVSRIIKKCRNGELNDTHIAILSCYFPLYKLLDQIPKLKSFNSSKFGLKELIKLQIREPLKEIELSKKIKRLGAINDTISQKVKSQYEENPYPRWRYGNLSTQKSSFLQVINNEIYPNSTHQSIEDKQLNILIAGCGTGNQILQAQRYQNAHITAIDLSLSSLSYAQRKINELGIDNVELIQMDILEVSLLEKRFHIVESGGVLHHMNDPEKGLRALVKVLNNNGYLKLGLYSELARQDIVKIKNYIANKQLQPNEEDIRRFRQKVISGDLSNLNSLEKNGDFYSLSQCRDLYFHFKEHRFTISQLQETLKSNKLKFLGFLLPRIHKSRYNTYFPKDKKQTNLQNWARFEEKYPNTFAAMYQFWVSKISMV